MLTSSEGKNIMNREPSTNSGFKGWPSNPNAQGRKPPFIVRKFYSTAGELNPQNVPAPWVMADVAKHTIALLLTWVNDPNSFQEVGEIDSILEKLSKPELITLIKQMIEQEPDLESLLELPVAGGENKPLNMKLSD